MLNKHDAIYFHRDPNQVQIFSKNIRDEKNRIYHLDCFRSSLNSFGENV
jgi:hypothetical protein